MKGLLLRLTGFVLACALGILLLLFAMELLVFRDSRYGGLQAEQPSLEGDVFSVKLSGGEDLRLFKGYRCQVEGDTLYITVYSGDFYTSFRCRAWPVTIRMQDPALENVEQVCFRDGSSLKRIYPE